MKIRTSSLFATAIAASTLMASQAMALAPPGPTTATTVTIDGADDIYNAGASGTEPGGDPVALNVSGIASITFSDTSGLVTLNSGGNYNDADGVGAAPSSSSESGANSIAGLTAPGAGYITGVFLGSTLESTPTALDFSSGTTFTSLSPGLQQAFFIGDGLTGDGTGATQTFYVPTGAATLYLGISDACSYNGSPSCYSDNSGTFTTTVNEASAGTTVSAAPEPAAWLLMIAGLGGIGLMLRRTTKYVGLRALSA